jgi:hypothetical protein
MPTGQARSQAHDAGEGGLGTETVLGPLQHQWWVQIILITQNYLLFKFDCPGLSLEGVRLRMCFLALMLMGNVASPPLGCRFFKKKNSSFDAFRPSLEPGP